MASNIIELVFKLNDQVSKPLASLRSKLGGALAFGAGVAGVTTFGAAINKMIHATQEAQDALVKFDLAFKNLGATSGKTREEMLKFADTASKSTIFDDESILRAQAALLKFQSISGSTFNRARQAAIDLASAIGTDLESATETVGRALQRPEVGIRQLRAAGILFTADQEKMIRALVKTGDTATAAEIVLQRLEKQFKGAGAAAAGTLSGALARTKTAFDNLFEGNAENTQKMTGAVDALAKALNNPDVKAGIAELISGMATLVSWAVKAAAAFATMGKSIADALSKSHVDTATESLRRELASRQIELRESANMGFTPEALARQKAYIETLKERIQILKDLETVGKSKTNRTGGDRGSSGSVLDTQTVLDGMAEIEEVIPHVFEVSKGAMQEFFDQLDQNTQTAEERAADRFETIKAELQILRDAGQISGAEFAARWKQAAEDGLEEVVPTVKAVAIVPIATAFDNLVDQFADAMERMLNNGKLSWKELGQYFLREVLTGWIKKAIDALAASLKGAFSGMSMGGGFFGALAKGVGSLFGFASGGWGSGWAMVGEEGPELVNLGAGSRVYNKRQMAFAGMGGGGGNVSIGGATVVIQGDATERTVGLITEALRLNNAQQGRQLSRVLEANGIRRPVR